MRRALPDILELCIELSMLIKSVVWNADPEISGDDRENTFGIVSICEDADPEYWLLLKDGDALNKLVYMLALPSMSGTYKFCVVPKSAIGMVHPKAMIASQPILHGAVRVSPSISSVK